MLKILLSLLLTITFSAKTYADADDVILPLLGGIAIGAVLPRAPPPPIYYAPQSYAPPPVYYPQPYYPEPQRVYVPVPAPVYYQPAYQYEGHEHYHGHHGHHGHRRWHDD